MLKPSPQFATGHLGNKTAAEEALARAAFYRVAVPSIGLVMMSEREAAKRIFAGLNLGAPNLMREWYRGQPKRVQAIVDAKLREPRTPFAGAPRRGAAAMANVAHNALRRISGAGSPSAAAASAPGSEVTQIF